MKQVIDAKVNSGFKCLNDNDNNAKAYSGKDRIYLFYCSEIYAQNGQKCKKTYTKIKLCIT